MKSQLLGQEIDVDTERVGIGWENIDGFPPKLESETEDSG